MAQDSPSRKLDQYMVRFPDGLRDRIAEVAKKNKRSMNQEIIDRLEETFNQDEWLPEGLDYSDMIGEIEDEMTKLEELQQKYDRQYGLDYFDAFKDEILEAIREKKKK